MSFLEEENLNFSNVFESRTMLIEITIFLEILWFPVDENI